MILFIDGSIAFDDSDADVALKKRLLDNSNSPFDDIHAAQGDTHIANHDNALDNIRTDTVDNEETNSSIKINELTLVKYESEITGSRDNVIRDEQVHTPLDDRSSAATRKGQHIHNANAISGNASAANSEFTDNTRTDNGHMEMNNSHTQRDHNACYADNGNSQKPVIYEKIRLPHALRPSLYEITLLPDIYGNDPNTFSYQCKSCSFTYCLYVKSSLLFAHALELAVLQARMLYIGNTNLPTGKLDKFHTHNYYYTVSDFKSHAVDSNPTMSIYYFNVRKL